ncbi:MAG: Nif3-like dinuclear metal center hexameric protein [Pirellulaceae bacterium]
MSTTIEHVCQTLATIAPLRLAESWDNVGLLIGDRKRTCQRVMTCLTISPPVVAEAIAKQVDLIVAHHPLPFKPLQKLTTDSTASSMVLELAANRIAVYSAHTAFDSAGAGINQQLAAGLLLDEIEPLVPEIDASSSGLDKGKLLGSGRLGGRLARISGTSCIKPLHF